MAKLNEFLSTEEEMLKTLSETIKNNLRVSCPGIIETFDAVAQTVSVKLAIREKIKSKDNAEWTTVPELLDVPIVIPKAGNYALTLPIKEGDECLVMFSDMCIDAWFSNGGVQDQLEKRRHDLSDSFAILGTCSQPNVLPNYSTDSTQLRNESGEAYIELKDNTINIVADHINVTSRNECSLKGSSVTSNALDINTHTRTVELMVKHQDHTRE